MNLDQTVTMAGPIKMSEAFLNGLTVQNITMGDAPHPMITFAHGDQSTVVTGFEPTTGKACGVLDSPTCLRGARRVTRDPNEKVGVRISDISMDIRHMTAQQVNYNVELTADLLIKKHATCDKAQGWLGRMKSVPGMHAGTDPSNQEAFVDVAANSSAAFFLPVSPIPGNPGMNGSPCLTIKTLDEYDCCFTTTWTAAACYYFKQPIRQTYLPVTVAGNFTLMLGGAFVVNMLGWEQSELMVAMNGDVRDFNFHSGSLKFSCDTITWL